MHPLVYKRAMVDYGKSGKFVLNFINETVLEFSGILNKEFFTDRVEYTTNFVTDYVYMVTWYENKYRNYVTQVHNFQNLTLYSSIVDCSKNVHILLNGKIIL